MQSRFGTWTFGKQRRKHLGRERLRIVAFVTTYQRWIQVYGELLVTRNTLLLRPIKYLTWLNPLLWVLRPKELKLSISEIESVSFRPWYTNWGGGFFQPAVVVKKLDGRSRTFHSMFSRHICRVLSGLMRQAAAPNRPTRI